MCLLHKNVQFETIPITVMDLRNDLVKRSNNVDIKAPIIELEDGTFIHDSFRIAQWLERNYPDQPSLFSGNGKTTNESNADELALGERYSRFIDFGLGGSDPQWAIWFELFFPEFDRLMSVDEQTRIYFRSDQRLGPNGYEKLLSLSRDDLIRRAKSNLQPLTNLLRENSNSFLQGSHAGLVDYILFGRYAYGRMLNPDLCREIWNEQSTEVDQWINRLTNLYDRHAERLFSAATTKLDEL